MTHTEPHILATDCKGPNPACRAAHRAGRPVHVIPPRGRFEIVNDRARKLDPTLVLATYHFATAEDGMAAIADAIANAPTVATDDDLYAFRAAGVAHFLPVGWIDPTCRRTES